MARLPQKTAPKPVAVPPVEAAPEPGDTGSVDPVEDLQGDGSEPEPEPTPAPAKAAPRKAAKGTVKAATPLTGLDDLEEHINICYYGTEGSGKTTDALFVANLGRTLVINAEAGIKGRRLKQLGVNTANITVWPSPGEDITFAGLEELYWRVKGDLLEDPNSWTAIVWDSLTEITKKLLDDVVQYQVSKAERAGKERERFFIDRADYGTMTEQARQLTRRFRDLPCHFIMTALERRDQDDDGSVQYGPAVTPAFATDVGGYVDLLFHCRVNEGLAEDGEPEELFAAYTRKGTKYRAKDRWAATPRMMADPYFDRVVAYVREELTAADDPHQLAAKESVGRLNAREEERKASKARRTAA